MTRFSCLDIISTLQFFDCMDVHSVALYVVVDDLFFFKNEVGRITAAAVYVHDYKLKFQCHTSHVQCITWFLDSSDTNSPVTFRQHCVKC